MAKAPGTDTVPQVHRERVRGVGRSPGLAVTSVTCKRGQTISACKKTTLTWPPSALFFHNSSLLQILFLLCISSTRGRTLPLSLQSSSRKSQQDHLDKEASLWVLYPLPGNSIQEEKKRGELHGELQSASRKCRGGADGCDPCG